MKPLDRWARDFGYNDYDTFIRGGGSVGEAMRDISRNISRLVAALKQLQPEISSEAERMAKTPPSEPPGNFHTEPEADKLPDPDNAHVQGAEFGEH